MKQGRQTGRDQGVLTPGILEGGLNACRPPLILRRLFLIAHICYYVQVISIWEGGRLAPYKLI